MFGHTHIPFRQFPRLFPVVTSLFLIQAVIFLIMTIMGGTQSVPNLIRFGALEPLLVSYGEWWRLVVPIFIHIGLFHILFNSFALYLFGPQLEWLFGRIAFLFLYLSSGFVGNLMTYWFMTWAGQTGVSAGASGSIYGLMGVYLYLIMRRAIEPEVSKGLLTMIGISVLMSILDPRINLIAHLGGLFTGFLLTGLLLRPKE
ncbi:MAG: rhomboid family intramembrane serine protease [Planifilum sp.]|jgi:rhomboid protease GluP